MLILGKQHEVHAFRATNGDVLWTTVLPVNRERTVGFGGARAPNGTLLVGDERLFALNERDGSIVWEFSTPEAVDIGRDVPELWNDLVIVASSSGYVLGVDVASGTERWRQFFGPGVGRVSTWIGAVVDGAIPVGLTDFRNGLEPKGAVAVLEAATGTVRWRRDIPYHLTPTGPTATIDPLIAGSVVVVSARDGPGYAFDVRNGSLRWKVPIFPQVPPVPEDNAREIHHFATCGGRLLVSSTNREILALDPETGSRLWAARMERGHGMDLSCDNTTVFAVALGGQLETFRLADGSPTWRIIRNYVLDGKPIYAFGGQILSVDGFAFGGSVYGTTAMRLK